MKKYSSQRMFMIELLRNLKFFGTFHLNSIGELVGYNEKFQPQEIVEVVKKNCWRLFLCLNFFWTFLSLKYFVFCTCR
jgi:hypothetical protein